MHILPLANDAWYYDLYHNRWSLVLAITGALEDPSAMTTSQHEAFEVHTDASCYVLQIAVLAVRMKRAIRPIAFLSLGLIVISSTFIVNGSLTQCELADFD